MTNNSKNIKNMTTFAFVLILIIVFFCAIIKMQFLEKFVFAQVRNHSQNVHLSYV